MAAGSVFGSFLDQLRGRVGADLDRERAAHAEAAPFARVDGGRGVALPELDLLALGRRRRIRHGVEQESQAFGGAGQDIVKEEVVMPTVLEFPVQASCDIESQESVQ